MSQKKKSISNWIHFRIRFERAHRVFLNTLSRIDFTLVNCKGQGWRKLEIFRPFIRGARTCTFHIEWINTSIIKPILCVWYQNIFKCAFSKFIHIYRVLCEVSERASDWRWRSRRRRWQRPVQMFRFQLNSFAYCRKQETHKKSNHDISWTDSFAWAHFLAFFKFINFHNVTFCILNAIISNKRPKNVTFDHINCHLRHFGYTFKPTD